MSKIRLKYVKKITSSKTFKCIAAVFVISLTTLLFLKLPHKLEPSFSRVVYADDDSILRAYLSDDEKWRIPTHIENIPDFSIKALLCLEDKRFYMHPGFDPIAISRAAINNMTSRRRLGASTITMQLARLLEPKSRNYSSKFKEILRSLQIEIKLSKSKILEKYLQLAPYGLNIEGIESASQMYFNKKFKELEIDQIAFLYLLPQNPQGWKKWSESKLKSKRNAVLGRWQKCELIDKVKQLKFSRKPVPKELKRRAFLAHHYSDMSLSQNPGLSEIRTYINSPLQQRLERFVKSKQRYFQNRNVSNISILVLDNKENKVISAVGNFDYFQKTNSQNYSSFQIPRSIGSTLKPLLFTQLINQGQILPESLVRDIPIKINKYEPQNFDGNYDGLVSAEKALMKSLNVPFVYLLKKAGFKNFLNLLRSMNLSHRLDGQILGLSMIIGAIELTQLDLLQIYSVLAQNGSFKKIQNFKSDVSWKSQQILDSGSIQLTNQVLSQRKRPDSEYLGHSLDLNPDINWKTGTSQGKKDALSTGYNNSYTVSVWLGNLDRKSSSILTGSKSAAPIMFDVFSLLSDKQNIQKTSSNLLKKVKLCAFSGLLASTKCPHKVLSFMSRNAPLRHVCPYHQKALVETDTGLRVNSSCSAGLKTKIKTFVNLDRDTKFWSKKNNLPLNYMPTFHPKCLSVNSNSEKLKIKSPRPFNYLIKSNMTELTLPLTINSTEDLSSLACLLNGRSIALNNRDQFNHVNVKVGQNSIQCSDSQGRSAKVSFNVINN